jgi:hypothetical protein
VRGLAPDQAAEALDQRYLAGIPPEANRSSSAADERPPSRAARSADVAEALVIALGVVVLDELADDDAKMALAERDDVPR